MNMMLPNGAFIVTRAQYAAAVPCAKPRPKHPPVDVLVANFREIRINPEPGPVRDDWLIARNVLRRIAQDHGMDEGTLRSKRRTRPIVEARHAAIAAIHAACPALSSPDIGSLMNLNHTSVLYALGRIPPKTRKVQP